MPPPPLQREEPGARQGPQLPTATWPANRGAERETQMWLTTQRGPGGAERPQAAHPGSSPARPPLTWMCMYRNRRHRHRRQGPPGGTSDEEPANAMQEMQETRTQSLRQEDPLQEEMATHSSLLGRRIPWTEEPGGVWCTGLQRVGHD